MNKIINLDTELINSELLDWEEKIILSIIKQGNEYFKETGFKPTLKYFAEYLGCSQMKVRYIMYKMVGIGLLKYTYREKEEKANYYTIDPIVLDMILNNTLTYNRIFTE